MTPDVKPLFIMPTKARLAVSLVGAVSLIVALWFISQAAIPLELGGQLVGVLFMFYGCLLGGRHLFWDGYQYPWYIPVSAAAAGVGVTLIVTQFAIAGILSSVRITRIGYVILFTGGTLAFLAYWTDPKTHAEYRETFDHE